VKQTGTNVKGATLETDPYSIDTSKPGAKLDAGKVQAGTLALFGDALMEVMRLATFGANKYSRGGFLHVPNGHERYSDAMVRHYLKEESEGIDPETGIHHDVAVAWNALARLQLKLMEKQKRTESNVLENRYEGRS